MSIAKKDVIAETGREAIYRQPSVHRRGRTYESASSAHQYGVIDGADVIEGRRFTDETQSFDSVRFSPSATDEKANETLVSMDAWVSTGCIAYLSAITMPTPDTDSMMRGCGRLDSSGFH